MSRLQALGASVELVDAVDGIRKKWQLRQKLKSAQLLFVQRRYLPAWAIPGNVPMIYDVDDAIFCTSNGAASPGRKRRFGSMVSRSSLVLAGNQFLAEQCAGHVSLVAPTAVAPLLSKDHVGTATRLLWIGSKSTARYLESHKAQLNAIGEAVPGAELDVVADFNLTLDHLTVNNVPWSAEAEQRALERADVGIAPMFDNTWTRGKCALKVLQYMSAGLPVISSGVGANRDVIVDGETGLLADAPVEWVEAMQQLQLAARRQAMGEAGYARLVEHYSPDAVFGRTIRGLTDNGLLPEARPLTIAP